MVKAELPNQAEGVGALLALLEMGGNVLLFWNSLVLSEILHPKRSVICVS